MMRMSLSNRPGDGKSWFLQKTYHMCRKAQCWLLTKYAMGDGVWLWYVSVQYSTIFTLENIIKAQKHGANVIYRPFPVITKSNG